ncbi:hypothetical protein U1Q18_016738, partial [Sarracenia purpurea var. burkii]
NPQPSPSSIRLRPFIMAKSFSRLRQLLGKGIRSDSGNFLPIDKLIYSGKFNH